MIKLGGIWVSPFEIEIFSGAMTMWGTLLLSVS